MKHLLIPLLFLWSIAVYAQQGSDAKTVYKSRVDGGHASRDTSNVAFTGPIAAGVADNFGYWYWNAQATNPHWDIYTAAGVQHVFSFSGGGSNSSTALTDASTITITGLKHTLTSDEATITWTLSQTSDFQTTDIILNATSTTWTFPANALCVVDGVSSGTNTAALTGVSGDHHIMSIYKDGTNYRVVIKNFGQ